MQLRLAHHVARLVLVLLVTLPCATALAADGDEELSLDALHEEMRVSTARLEYTLEKVDRISFPMGGDDRRVSRDLIARGRMLMKQAATVPGSNHEGITDITSMLLDLRVEADAFLSRVTPLWQEPVRKDYSGKYRSAYMEVIKFQDVTGDVVSIKHLLSPEESARLAEIQRSGDDTIAEIKTVREKDHMTRDVLVRKLMGFRKELLAMHEAATGDRTPGYPFVSLQRAQGPWTELGHLENGLEGLRTRFIEPQTAYLTIRNPGEEWRPVYVEMQFFDASGSPTGTGTYETLALEELRSGEVREVLVPIHATHPRFWDVTRSYSVSLN